MSNDCTCDEYFGGGRIINVGRDHYAICDACRVYEHVGSNLFDFWRHETPEQWEENQAELLLLNEKQNWGGK